MDLLSLTGFANDNCVWPAAVEASLFLSLPDVSVVVAVDVQLLGSAAALPLSSSAATTLEGFFVTGAETTTGWCGVVTSCVTWLQDKKKAGGEESEALENFFSNGGKLTVVSGTRFHFQQKQQTINKKKKTPIKKRRTLDTMIAGAKRKQTETKNIFLYQFSIGLDVHHLPFYFPFCRLGDFNQPRQIFGDLIFLSLMVDPRETTNINIWE